MIFFPESKAGVYIKFEIYIFALPPPPPSFLVPSRETYYNECTPQGKMFSLFLCNSIYFKSIGGEKYAMHTFYQMGGKYAFTHLYHLSIILSPQNVIVPYFFKKKNI